MHLIKKTGRSNLYEVLLFFYVLALLKTFTATNREPETSESNVLTLKQKYKIDHIARFI